MKRAILLSAVMLSLSVISRAFAATWIQDKGASVKNNTTLTVTLGVPVTAGNIIVAKVAYTNTANDGRITISGLGATWSAGYQPPAQSGLGVAFIYGQNPTAGQSKLTISVRNKDSLATIVQEWSGLSATEDPGSQAMASGNSTAPTVSSTTTNPNDVVFNFVAYSKGYISPPQTAFRSEDVPVNFYSPIVTGGYYNVGAAGAYTDNFVLSAAATWVSASVALESTTAYAAPYTNTALTDYTSSQRYLGKFPGFLYTNSNTMPAAHDTDGRTFDAQVQPLDSNGNPSSSGRIGVVGIGMSSWAEELCTGSKRVGCDPNTFFDQASRYSGVDPSMTLASCAISNAEPPSWENPASSAWSTCLNSLLPAAKLTPAQVQVVLWKDADDAPGSGQLVSLSSLSGTVCPSNPNPLTDPDACVYEQEVAIIARLIKTTFPNVKQMFLHSRIYGGYAPPTSPHGEPVTYEYGFATKWLIAAQINQVAGLGTDPLAGDLSYSAAPWLAWGPYFWAPTTTPRKDGIQWLGGDLGHDGIHASQCRFYGINCGREQVGNLMMGFYPTGPYSTWFVTP